MANLVYHNSYETFYRNPFGAVAEEEKITIRIKISSLIEVNKIYLRIWKDAEENIEMIKAYSKEGFDIYEAFFIADKTGLMWYQFLIQLNDKTYYYCNNDEMLGGEGILLDFEGKSYQITVYEKDFKTPNWFKEAVAYQIFVDRFFNGNDNGNINVKQNVVIHSNWYETPEYKESPLTGRYEANDFFGGNLLGIIKKLPYLKELGVDVLYLNPIFEAYSNHKYDTGDYTKVDSMFGSNEVFKELCERAKEFGIRIILDGVFNHTGSDSVYFNKYGRYNSIGAYQSKDSPYYKWYRFFEHPDKYECWWGFDTLPCVNELEPSYMDFIIRNEESIVKMWIKYGAKGWRLDVVDEIPDEFLEEFRKEVKRIDSDAVIIGEVWEDASNKISYSKRRRYLLGKELDSVMNYPLRNMIINFIIGRWKAERFYKGIMNIYENYPKECFYSLLNLLGSHDVARILTVLGDAPEGNDMCKDDKAKFKLTYEKREFSKKRLKVAVLLQMTLPGVPCIYYGDEVGLEGYEDPFNRRTFPWGFEENDILEYYIKLIKIRHQNDALKTGEFIPFAINDDVFAFFRYIKNGFDAFNNSKNNGHFLIVVNRNPVESQKVSIDLKDLKNKEAYDILRENKIDIEEGYLNLNLNPLEGMILSLDRME